MALKGVFLASCLLAFGRCAEILLLGTDAPPTEVAGFQLVPFPEDNRATNSPYSTVPTGFGSNIGFSPKLWLDNLPNGHWSHGYEGKVYWEEANRVTVTLPTLCAFVFYVNPNNENKYMTRVDIGSGVFVEVEIDSPKAQGFAIYDDGNGMPNTVVVEVFDSGNNGQIMGEFSATECSIAPTTTTRLPTTTLLPTTTTRMPTTSTLLPTTTTQKPTTTTLLPTTTRLPTSTGLPTSTELPTSTLLPTTTWQSSAGGWESTSASPMSSLAVFECFDQCVIAAQRVDDGYCDCGQCEDESIWSCDACGGCPLSCGLSVQCQRQSTTSLESTSNEKPGSGGKKKSVDVVMVVAVSVGCFFGPVLCFLAVYYYWFENSKEEVTEEVIVVMSTSKGTGEPVAASIELGKVTRGRDSIDAFLKDGKYAPQRAADSQTKGWHIADARDALSDEDLDEEMMYLEMPKAAATAGAQTDGHYEADALSDKELDDEMMYLDMPATVGEAGDQWPVEMAATVEGSGEFQGYWEPQKTEVQTSDRTEGEQVVIHVTTAGQNTLY